MFKKIKLKLCKDSLDISYDLHSINEEEWLKIFKQYPLIKKQIIDLIDIYKNKQESHIINLANISTSFLNKMILIIDKDKEK
jgi:nicotinic acid phosphoribosyltransferase